jgi:hypothetical protein
MTALFFVSDKVFSTIATYYIYRLSAWLICARKYNSNSKQHSAYEVLKKYISIKFLFSSIFATPHKGSKPPLGILQMLQTAKSTSNHYFRASLSILQCSKQPKAHQTTTSEHHLAFCRCSKQPKAHQTTTSEHHLAFCNAPNSQKHIKPLLYDLTWHFARKKT